MYWNVKGLVYETSFMFAAMSVLIEQCLGRC